MMLSNTFSLASKLFFIGTIMVAHESGAQTKEASPAPAAAKPATAEMKVITVKEEPSVVGPAENFTGSVRVSRLVAGESPSELTAGSVTFQPGARSNWHTHPKGQLLIVSEGIGRVQEWGKPLRKIKVGDVIWTPPNVKHWHGAASHSAMTHLAVTEPENGTAVVWLERVTDSDYKKPAQ